MKLRRILGAVFACGSISLFSSTVFAFPADFDGDGKRDLVVYRAAYGNWYVYPSTYATTGQCPPAMSQTGFGGCVRQHGLPGDQPITGDFDVDGKTDFVVRRLSNNTVYVGYSSGVQGTQFSFGMTGDVVDEMDINGDGRSELYLFQPSTKLTVVRYYTGTQIIESTYGGPAIQGTYHEPVEAAPGTYQNNNGEVNNDPGIYIRLEVPNAPATRYRLAWAALQISQINPPANSQFAVAPIQSSTNAIFTLKPVPGNYGGAVANLADFAHFDPSNGNWTIYFNGAGTTQNFNWGLPTDIPVQGDFNGDGIADPAVFRPNEGGSGGSRWYVKTTAICPNYMTPAYSDPPANTIQVGCYKDWGLNGDIPIN